MLDNFRAISVTWDHSTNTIYNNIRTASEDANGRKLVVQVVNGHQLEDLTSVDLRLYWEFDEHKGFDDFELIDEDNGIYEIHFSTDMVSHVGAHKAWLHLVDAEGTVTSEPFTVTVFEGVDADTIQDSNEFSALSNALVAISDLETNYAPRLNSVENNKADKATVNSEVSRLDQKDADLTAQLAQIESEKVGGGVKAKLEDLSPNVLSAIEGGEGTSFELLSIPQDDSVTPEKTTFVRRSKNLYNQNTSIDNTILVSGGEVEPQRPGVAEEDIRTTSDFIPILGGTTYSVNQQLYLQVYDEDKNPLGGLQDRDKDTPLVSTGWARYVRVTIRKSYKETFQFEQGSVPTEYEPYGLIIKDLIVDGLSNFMTEENEGWAI